MPPTPKMGICTTRAAWYTQRRASGLMAAPDNQPKPSLLPISGRPVSRSMLKHGPNELIITSPSAPAFSSATAISWMLGCGLSFMNTGTSTAAFAALSAFTIGEMSLPT